MSDKMEKLRRVIQKYVREEVANIFESMVAEIHGGASYRPRANRSTALDQLYEEEVGTGDMGARSGGRRSERLLRENINSRRAGTTQTAKRRQRSLGEQDLNPLGASLALLEGKLSGTLPEEAQGIPQQILKERAGIFDDEDEPDDVIYEDEGEMDDDEMDDDEMDDEEYDA